MIKKWWSFKKFKQLNTVKNNFLYILKIIFLKNIYLKVTLNLFFTHLSHMFNLKKNKPMLCLLTAKYKKQFNYIQLNRNILLKQLNSNNINILKKFVW